MWGGVFERFIMSKYTTVEEKGTTYHVPQIWADAVGHTELFELFKKLNIDDPKPDDHRSFTQRVKLAAWYLENHAPLLQARELTTS